MTKSYSVVEDKNLYIIRSPYALDEFLEDIYFKRIYPKYVRISNCDISEVQALVNDIISVLVEGKDSIVEELTIGGSVLSSEDINKVASSIARLEREFKLKVERDTDDYIFVLSTYSQEKQEQIIKSYSLESLIELKLKFSVTYNLLLSDVKRLGFDSLTWDNGDKFTEHDAIRLNRLEKNIDRIFERTLQEIADKTDGLRILDDSNPRRNQDRNAREISHGARGNEFLQSYRSSIGPGDGTQEVAKVDGVQEDTKIDDQIVLSHNISKKDLKV